VSTYLDLWLELLRNRPGGKRAGRAPISTKPSQAKGSTHDSQRQHNPVQGIQAERGLGRSADDSQQPSSL